MAGLSASKRADLEALRADLQQARGDIDFRSQAHLPPHGGHLSALDRAISHVNEMLGDTDDTVAPDADPGTQVPTVPPGSAGGAAANPVTGATTNVPFSQSVADGETSSIPGAPDYDPAAQSEVELDAAQRQHAAERVDSDGGASGDAAKARGAARGK